VDVRRWATIRKHDAGTVASSDSHERDLTPYFQRFFCGKKGSAKVRDAAINYREPDHLTTIVIIKFEPNPQEKIDAPQQIQFKNKKLHGTEIFQKPQGPA